MGADQKRIAVSPTAAAELLQMGRVDAMRWLAKRGLVRTLVDTETRMERKLVLVSDIEAQIRLESPSPIDAALGLAPEPVVPQRARPKPRHPFIDPRD